MRLCESCIFHIRGLVSSREDDDSEEEEKQLELPEQQEITETCKQAIEVLNFLFQFDTPHVKLNRSVCLLIDETMGLMQKSKTCVQLVNQQMNGQSTFV